MRSDTSVGAARILLECPASASKECRGGSGISICPGTLVPSSLLTTRKKGTCIGSTMLVKSSHGRGDICWIPCVFSHRFFKFRSLWQSPVVGLSLVAIPGEVDKDRLERQVFEPGVLPPVWNFVVELKDGTFWRLHPRSRGNKVDIAQCDFRHFSTSASEGHWEVG